MTSPTGTLADHIAGKTRAKWDDAFVAVAAKYDVAKPVDSMPYAGYKDDPAGFARDVFGIELWERQVAVAESVATKHRTAVRSGHKVGKSTLAAILAWWWPCTRSDGQTILTSSGFKQVKHILWKEFRVLWKRAEDRGHHVGPEPGLDPENGVVYPDGIRAVYGFTTSAAEKMAGFSGHELFFIVDEASGFPDDIYEAVEGNLAGGGRILATGNPTQTTGWFFELFRSQRAAWTVFEVSSETTPNAVSGEQLIPGLATREWIAMMREKYGPDYERNPVYMVRVLGIPPEQASDSVIGLGDVTAAMGRWPGAEPDGPLQIGVDPARFGDDETVITAVRGRYKYPSVVFQGLDGGQVAHRVIDMINAVARPDELPVPVKIDGIGVGSSVVDFLRRSPGRIITVCDINVGERATDPNYVNLRSQLWFAIGDWLKDGGCLDADADLEQELLAPMFTLDKRNRIEVEQKKQIRKKIKRSPDRADALALAIYQAAGPTEIRTLPNKSRRAVRSLRKVY